ncbi:hypothetical protein [Streptomyces iconiensis]|uniref:Uncharacterized protein n=1 Tax=Streptomyces iconiensis TaxID=1384038 RepID=A0ABT7A8A3_9ACTN|nr:hypothetical protein [Streptomyces iconiensis]MDJ1137244.1 hypothetical protein [Streptomyces iconiensis]
MAGRRSGRWQVGGWAVRGGITGWRDAWILRDANAPGARLSRCHLIANIFGAPLQRDDGSSRSLFWFRIAGNTGPGSVNPGN